MDIANSARRASSPAAKSSSLRFRKHDKVGRADAEEDAEFLSECFVDTGDLDVLLDCGDTRRIVIGRTGAGKTTLLHKVEANGRAIRIQPENLALEYISNSDILQFVAALGVNLNTFFKLLWRHVLAVEIIRTHFKIVDVSAKASLLDRIKRFFTGKRDQEALEYLEEWGESFWQETDYRIREVTTKLEDDIRASLQTAGLPVQFSTEGAKRLSAEERIDVIHRAQEVINQVQIRKLSTVLELLDRVLDDPQDKYYIVIDRLDEDWVEDDVRYPLIRALIETSRDFRKIRNAKVILALRIDLIERVFQVTRDAGFQEEKYESQYLPVTWTAKQLTTVLDARINHLLRGRRADTKVTHRDVLPERVGKVLVMEYMLERALMRPRDIILFFNYCIAEAVDRPQITATMIRQAEGEYSKDRLRSLGDEWGGRIPHLLRAAALFKASPESFCLRDVDAARLEELCLAIAADDDISQDELTSAARQVADCHMSAAEFARVLVSVLFRVGLLGVRLSSGSKPVWSCNGARTVTSAELSPETRALIHPCFHRALAVTPSEH